jgi:Jacalin-like lectin domain
MTLSKFAAVGGDGGCLFDSGCNTSGVTKVRIECEPIRHNGKQYLNTIKRIWLEFHCPTADCPARPVTYPGYPLPRGDYEVSTFIVEPYDQIVKIVVWSDGILVNAIEFHTKQGCVSPRYGMPTIGGHTVAEFQGDDSSILVGVHGRVGSAIEKLGFSFATDLDMPGMVLDDSSRTLDSTDSARTLECSQAGRKLSRGCIFHAIGTFIT